MLADQARRDRWSPPSADRQLPLVTAMARRAWHVCGTRPSLRSGLLELAAGPASHWCRELRSPAIDPHPANARGDLGSSLHVAQSWVAVPPVQPPRPSRRAVPGRDSVIGLLDEAIAIPLGDSHRDAKEARHPCLHPPASHRVHRHLSRLRSCLPTIRDHSPRYSRDHAVTRNPQADCLEGRIPAVSSRDCGRVRRGS
jgi:hypothetical protein